MITLYRAAQCDACDEVQNKLRELVVAHKVVDIDGEIDGARPAVVANKELPVIADGEQLVSGEPALSDYLAGLTQEMEQWRKFQTDACYIDDQGKTC